MTLPIQHNTTTVPGSLSGVRACMQPRVQRTCTSVPMSRNVPSFSESSSGPLRSAAFLTHLYTGMRGMLPGPV